MALTPFQENLVLEDFKSIRREIEMHEERMSKVFTVAVTALPAAIGLSYQYDISAILIALPFVVVAFFFLFRHYEHSIVLAAHYLRHLEKEALANTPFGWETFLQEHRETLPIKLYFNRAARLTFVLMIILSVALAIVELIPLIESLRARADA